MAVVFLSFIIIVLSLAGLSVGVMFGRTPIKGSCGGLGHDDCAFCPRRQKCEGQS